MPTLTAIFEKIEADLPWVENTRFIIGPLASRETVKDALLERVSIIPAWAAGTFAEIAGDLVKRAGDLVEKPLSLASRCDALERISETDLLKQAAPDLCVHLRARQVAAKIASFLSELDRFYSTEGELEALIEFFNDKNAQTGALLRVTASLWNAGELQPWGEGTVLRHAIQVIEEGRVQAPAEIYLWGFAEFTPLEEKFLETLEAAGSRIEVYTVAEACGQMRWALPLNVIDKSIPHKLWELHSPWDETEYLFDKLSELRAAGVEWREIALLIPNNDQYKRALRQKLSQKNIPLADPTLSGAWKDKPRWVWWRDFFRLIAGGLKNEDMRAWLSATRSLRQNHFDDGGTLRLGVLFQEAARLGLHGGASAWSKLSKKLENYEEIDLTVEASRLLGRSLTPEKLLHALEELVPKLEHLFGAEVLESSLVLDFARHLCNERPYLAQFRARLPRYISLFEEYLESASRELSVRAPEGVRFVGHGVWLPEQLRYAFVLGANLMTRARPTTDPWMWPAVGEWNKDDVRRIWDRLHLGLGWADKITRDEALLSYALCSHTEVTFSTVEYDLSGKPLPKKLFLKRILGEDAEVELRGGHPRTGWLVSQNKEELSQEALFIERPDLVADLAVKPEVRVSSFEDYLKCPFFYLIRHTLKLDDEPDVLGLDPDGRARGNVLHNVFRRFIEEELHSGHVPPLEQARERLRVLVHEEATAQPLSGMYRHEPLVKKAIAQLTLYAERWVEWEYQNREKHPELKPFAVEQPLDLQVGGLKLRGRADRIDSDGKHSVVIDYKTGQPPYSGSELLEGIGAQLLTYAAGAEVHHGLEPAAAYYLTIGRKIGATQGVFLKKHNTKLHTTRANVKGLVDGEFVTLFERVSNNWTRAAEQLARGVFSPQPSRGKKDCNACRYQPVCGFTPPEEYGEGE